jgi:cobalt-zinc-cadmium efflux system outer membrane protein
MNKLIVLFVFISFFRIGYAQRIDNKIKLSLNSAIETALNNNAEILSAKKEIDAADGKIFQAGRLQNAEFSLQMNEVSNRFAPGDVGQYDFSFSQPLEFFGKRTTRIQSAEFQKKITGQNFERVKSLIASRVKKTYYRGLLSKQIAQSIEANITLLDDFLAQVTNRYQAGTSNYLDVIRAKVELARLKNELFDAKKEHWKVTGELKVLLGKESGYELELTDSLTYRFLEMKKDSVISFYSSRSNYLRINEIQADQSKSYLSLAEKKYLPDFNFGFAYQYHQFLPAKGFYQYFGLNIGISLPMFYSSGVLGDIQEAEANLSISGIRLKYSKLKVAQNITTAFNNLSFAEEQLRLFETSLIKDVEDQLRAGITAYQNLQIDVLNLFDIYRTYRATKIEHSKTVFNCLAALAELEVAAEEAPLNLP